MTDLRTTISFELSYPELDAADAISQAKEDFGDEWDDDSVLVQFTVISDE